LWPDHSAAFLPVDGLAGVGQALHLADAFADRNGSVIANASFWAYNGPASTAISMDVMPQTVADPGHIHAPLQPIHPAGLPNTNIVRDEKATITGFPQSPLTTSEGESSLRCTMCNKSVRRHCELKYVGTCSSRVQSVASSLTIVAGNTSNGIPSPMSVPLQRVTPATAAEAIGNDTKRASTSSWSPGYVQLVCRTAPLASPTSVRSMRYNVILSSHIGCLRGKSLWNSARKCISVITAPAAFGVVSAKT
jgi:hypothetical protein